MSLESVRSMEKRTSAVNELLKTEIHYRERVERLQAQLSDMIFCNNEGKNVLEKALDLLNESHEEECISIVQKENRKIQTPRQSSEWASALYVSAHGGLQDHTELPNEVKTLDFVNEGIKQAIR